MNWNACREWPWNWKRPLWMPPRTWRLRSRSLIPNGGGISPNRRMPSHWALGNRMRRLQIGPALHDLPCRDSPNHDAAKFQFLIGLRIGCRPVIPHHHFVVFRDHVFDGHMEIRKPFQRSTYISNRSGWTWRHSGRNIRAVIDKIGREIHISDLHVFLVHKFFEVIANKLPRLAMGHSGFAVYRFHPNSLMPWRLASETRS